jgi:DUF4097 and DUF4098 domain-containing protein YvlB
MRPRIVVRLERGSVEVHGKAGVTAVQWSVKGHKGWYKGRGVLASTEGGTLTIVSEMNADVVLLVPQKFDEITVRTSAGDVMLSDLAANADVATDGGGLTFDHVAGLVRGSTGGGNIALHSSGMANTLTRLQTGGGNVLIDAADGDVYASSGGGNVNVTAARGSVKVVNGGGNVSVHQASGGVQLETGGGNVEMGDIGGDVSAVTAGGSIRLASAGGMVRAQTAAGVIDCRHLSSGLKAETGSGAIFAEYARGQHFLESRIETRNGDVTVWMPDTLAASIQVLAENPLGHSIRTDFDAVHVAHSREHHELRAEGLMNGGGPLLSIATANGSVLLLKASH